jgi:hypothetical protein
MFQAYFTVRLDGDPSVLVLIFVEDATEFQTEEDQTIIRKLIENYITDGRTIIL